MYRVLPTLAMVVFLTLSAASQEKTPAKTGSLTGVVRFVGTVPPPKKVTGSDGGTIELRDLIVDEKTKGLQFVGVVLEAPAQPQVKNAKMVLVDQRDMTFLPRVSACQHGQTVRFENNDLCNHSVMGISTVAENQFNQFAVPNQPVDRVFALQKVPVRIDCSLHPHMRAWVYVVPHPWFAVSDSKGNFRIDGIPEGKHNVRFHHADTGKSETRAVLIEAGKSARVEVEWK